MRALLATLLILFAGTGYAQSFAATESGLMGAAEPDFLPVEKAYQLEVMMRPDHGVRLYWQIAEHYYLYQHRFAFSMEDDNGAVAFSTNMPAGLKKADEYFGEVEVFYFDADISLQPERTTTGPVHLSVTSQGCADAGLCYPPHKEYFDLDFATGTATPTARPGSAQIPATQVKEPHEAPALWYIILLAFMGGAILNLMPCVFPILSLKVLGFARSADHDRHLQSWVYTAGVIASFVLVAAVLMGLQRAGSAIGWGFQLQSPSFVIALAYLFIAMGLSLSGLVELGSNLMNTGSSLANRRGLSGSFFTGVLAVVVASPCTAPFMGTALGYAISQPPRIGLLVFAALGAGMAAPLLLFSYSGAARALMPKPGAWMDTLKQFLAFPLYATAIWLLWVAGRQTGVNTMATALSGALMLALGLWLWNHSPWRKALAMACVVGAVSLGSVRGLDATNGGATTQLAQGHVAWSEESVRTLRDTGQPVFVDVTADWCITCIANESAVLHTADISQAFADNGVVYMVADWTNHNAEIAALLKKHGRNGIPLYLMYPPDTTHEPLILPQILTKSAVLEALEAVSRKKQEVVDIF